MLLGASSATAGRHGERDEEKHQGEKAISPPARRHDQAETEWQPHTEEGCEIVALRIGAEAHRVRSYSAHGDASDHNIAGAIAGY